MAHCGTAIYARLLATAGVTALVGAAGNARIYPVKLPQNPTFPAVTYAQTSQERQSTFTGPTGLPGDLYAFDCWGGYDAAGYTPARNLADAVRAAFDGVESWSAGGVTVQASWVEGGMRDIWEPDTNVHRVVLDVRLYWNEA